jgi:acyl-CoA synthetase (AMP-forming)/AMP-acid ligase II
MPLTKNREPNISFILDTAQRIAPHISKQARVSSSKHNSWHDRRRSAIVVAEKSGVKAGVDFHYKFLGRRDRMIKKRGYRIELAEIEAALYRHPAIEEAAVLAFPDEESVPVRAFASSRNGAKLSSIELKKFCSEYLPLYMVPDLFCCSSRCRRLRPIKLIIGSSRA